MNAVYTQALAAITERRALLAATEREEPWTVDEAEYIPEIHGWVRNIEPLVAGGVYDYDAQLIVAAVNAFERDTDALEAVFKRHTPDADEWCDCMRDTREGAYQWPCPDAQAALTALGVGQ